MKTSSAFSKCIKHTDTHTRTQTHTQKGLQHSRYPNTLAALVQCAEKHFGSWGWMCPKWTSTGCGVTFLQVCTSFRINSVIHIFPLSSTLSSNWTDYGLDSQGLITSTGKRFFSSPQCPDWLWGPQSFLSNGYEGSFPRDKAARIWRWPLTSIYCQGQKWWSYTSAPPYIFMVQCLIN
jgi:hypothetical protein